MNKVSIEIEHLPNGYWRAWYKVNTNTRDFLDSCNSFHSFTEASFWVSSQIQYIEEMLVKE